MDILRIVMLCLVAALIAMALRVHRPEMAAAVAMVAGLLALLMSLPQLVPVVEAFQSLSERAGLGSGPVTLMLRACGVTLICEFASGMCQDAGEGVLAGRVEFAGRVTLLVMAAPLLVELVERVVQWLPA